jgi:hypothetical protein
LRGGAAYGGRHEHEWLPNEDREGSRPEWSDKRERTHAVAKNRDGPHVSDREERKSLCLHCFDRTHLTLLLGVRCGIERSKDALDATRHVQC